MAIYKGYYVARYVPFLGNLGKKYTLNNTHTHTPTYTQRHTQTHRTHTSGERVQGVWWILYGRPLNGCNDAFQMNGQIRWSLIF